MLRIVSFCLVLLVAQGLAAQDTLFIRRLIHSALLNPYLSVLPETPGKKLEIEEVLQQAQAFRPYKEDSLSQTPALPAIWLRLTLTNLTQDTLHDILSMGTPDFADVYLPSDAGGYEVKHLGMEIPISRREINLGRIAKQRITLLPGKTKTCFIRMYERSGAAPRVNLKIQDAPSWELATYQILLKNLLPMSVFLGILLIMTLYNLMIFFSTRDNAYVYYCLYLLSLGFTLHFDTNAVIYPPLGFEQPYLNPYAGMAAMGLTIVFYILFGRSFVNTAEIMPKWDKALQLMAMVMAAGLALITLTALFTRFPVDTAMIWVICEVFVVMLVLPFFLFRLWKEGSGEGRFFTAGSTMVFFVAIMSIVIQNVLNTSEPNSLFIFILAIIAEILIFSLGLGYKMRRSQREKLAAQLQLNEELAKINTAFGRFVPHEFLSCIGRENATDVQLGDQTEREVTVLFSDIRAYTSLSEQMTPRENFNFLNAYLGRVGPLIRKSGGFVNQYYGDGIMAIFMEGPDQALRSAIEMQQAVREYNIYRQARGRIAIQIGIGMHTGSLMMGVIGDTLRMNAGVVSDTVNTASRMEGLTKHFGARILLSETTFAHVKDPTAYRLRSLGQVQVKGRREAVGVYECFDADPPPVLIQKQASSAWFEKGMRHYQQKEFEAAEGAFSEALRLCPEDSPAALQLSRSRQLRIAGLPEDWTPVEQMLEK